MSSQNLGTNRKILNQKIKSSGRPFFVINESYRFQYKVTIWGQPCICNQLSTLHSFIRSFIHSL